MAAVVYLQAKNKVQYDKVTHINRVTGSDIPLLIFSIQKVQSRNKDSLLVSGLQITAGQRTMSGQNWVLTGQILGLPDILSGPLPTRSEKF